MTKTQFNYRVSKELLEDWKRRWLLPRYGSVRKAGKALEDIFGKCLESGGDADFSPLGDLDLWMSRVRSVEKTISSLERRYGRPLEKVHRVGEHLGEESLSDLCVLLSDLASKTSPDGSGSIHPRFLVLLEEEGVRFALRAEDGTVMERGPLFSRAELRVLPQLPKVVGRLEVLEKQRDMLLSSSPGAG